MNAILANNVRLLRKIKNWTQEHLAQTAGVQLRTIQRVESAEGASADTLAALASGFDVSIDILRTDFDDAARQAREFENEISKTHAFVDMSPVTCSGDLAAIGGADASLMQCKSTSDKVQDAFAQFEAQVRDTVDLWNEGDAISRRSWLRALHEHVQILNALGYVVSIGTRNATLVHANGTRMAFSTLYVIAWPEADARNRIAVEKNMVPSFG